MNDKINSNQGIIMKTTMLLLSTFILLFVTGCTSNQAHMKLTSQKDFITEEALHDAVRAKDINQVKLLVEYKSDINAQDQYGYTPLHLAIRLNQYEIAKYLIEHGADVNSVDSYKDTPLLDATRDNNTKLAKLLLCHKAHKMVSDKYDMTPLHYSAKNKNKIITKLLLAKDTKQLCQQQPVSSKEIQLESKTNQIQVVQQKQLPDIYTALKKTFKDDLKAWNA